MHAHLYISIYLSVYISILYIDIYALLKTYVALKAYSVPCRGMNFSCNVFWVLFKCTNEMVFSQMSRSFAVLFLS